MNKIRAIWVGMVVLGAALVSGSALAQVSRSDVDELSNRLAVLEMELAELRGMAGASSVSGDAIQTNDPTLARLLVRLDQLEIEMGRLTGQIEEIQFKVDRVGVDLESLTKDTDFRLRALETGEVAIAQQSPREDIITPPAQPQAVTTNNILGTIPTELDPETDEARYQSALSYLKQGEHEQAEEALQAFLAEHGDSELAGNAQYWLGESYYVRQMYREAAAAFLEGVRKYPDGSKAPDSMLKLGMSLNALGQKREACTTLGEIARRYPTASQTILQRARVERSRAGCT